MNLRGQIVDGPTSIGARMRARRWDRVCTVFPELARYRVLDLGGTAEAWSRAPTQPKSVTILNLYDSELALGIDRAEPPDWMTLVAGDACNPPADVASESWDLVFSNSLIEHVGGPLRRRALAEFARNAAPRYWIQTPYRYFPVEPHYLVPGFQFMPVAARARIARSWPLMHTRARDWKEGVEVALEADLLSITELRYLFPDAIIEHERALGLTKSLVAVRT